MAIESGIVAGLCAIASTAFYVDRRHDLKTRSMILSLPQNSIDNTYDQASRSGSFYGCALGLTAGQRQQTRSPSIKFYDPLVVEESVFEVVDVKVVKTTTQHPSSEAKRYGAHTRKTKRYEWEQDHRVLEFSRYNTEGLYSISGDNSLRLMASTGIDHGSLPFPYRSNNNNNSGNGNVFDIPRLIIPSEYHYSGNFYGPWKHHFQEDLPKLPSSLLSSSSSFAFSSSSSSSSSSASSSSSSPSPSPLTTASSGGTSTVTLPIVAAGANANVEAHAHAHPIVPPAVVVNNNIGNISNTNTNSNSASDTHQPSEGIRHLGYSVNARAIQARTQVTAIGEFRVTGLNTLVIQPSRDKRNRPFFLTNHSPAEIGDYYSDKAWWKGLGAGLCFVGAGIFGGVAISQGRNGNLTIF